jgi:hypothetical protein
MRREVLTCLIPFEGMHRFLPTLAEFAGLRVRSLDVRHRPRSRGRSKYGVLGRLVAPLLDCLMLRRLKRRRLAPIEAAEVKRPGAEIDDAGSVINEPAAVGAAAAEK